MLLQRLALDMIRNPEGRRPGEVAVEVPRDKALAWLREHLNGVENPEARLCDAEVVLNHVLMTLGLIDIPKAYLATRGLALPLVILFQGWRYFPFAMLMILARLQAIDNTLYEAADVDGASVWQKFLYVTLPELRYVMGAIFLLRLMWTFNKFDDIWLLTGGGFGTGVLPVLTYQFSFQTRNFGKGAATAMIQLVILVVFIVVYLGIVMRNVEET